MLAADHAEHGVGLVAGHHGQLAEFGLDKQHERKVSGLSVDFVGLQVPDRYVFGRGMDYQEYWRQLPAIYAARD